MRRELLTNGTPATMERGGQAYGLVPGGAVALDGGRIAWCGPADALPGDHAGWPRRDLEGRLVTPAPIDRHTHIVHGGDRLAAGFGALSADHLEHAGEADVRALAGAGTVAVLLPGAFYTLHETRRPPVEAFRRHGVPMALATDCNPGSSPLTSLLLAMNMACTLLGLTPEEALAGATREAARALGLDDTGLIAEGLRADLAIWNVAHPAELPYRIGFNPLAERVFRDKNGRLG